MLAEADRYLDQDPDQEVDQETDLTLEASQDQFLEIEDVGRDLQVQGALEDLDQDRSLTIKTIR